MRTGIALVAVLLLAGCSGGDDDSTSSSSTTTTTRMTTSASVTATLPPPPPPPPTVSNATFQVIGTNCKELIGVVQIPMAQARAMVPARYTPLGDASGSALAFLGLKECDTTIDGASVGRASTADSGVLVSSPDGSDQNHYYQTWWLTDNATFAGRLVAQGWTGGLVGNNTLDAAAAPGVVPMQASVTWGNGSYTIAASTLSGPLPPANTFTGWHDGPHGTVAIRKMLTSTAFGTGNAAITATGDVTKLVGPTASGIAIYNEYSMVGSVGRK